MRSVARILLTLYVFTLPWAYSLDLGEPWGNIARILGVLTLAFTALAIAETHALKPPNAICIFAWSYFLLQCATLFWSVAAEDSWIELRSLFQKMMIVWLAPELTDRREQWRYLLLAFLGGMAVLALMTISGFRSEADWINQQLRYSAEGQDPNDTAHFLVLSLPLAALWIHTERSDWLRRGVTVYFPLTLAAILLTASRGGFLSLLIALPGCAWIFFRKSPRQAALAGLLLLSALPLLQWWLPTGTWERLNTIPEQLQGGDLNERAQIWIAGWDAVQRAPFFGSGSGTFQITSHTAWMDSAHNTLLSILVQSGLAGLLLMAAIVLAALRVALRLPSIERVAFVTSLILCAVSAQVSTIEESRPAWMLLALTSLAGEFRSPPHIEDKSADQRLSPLLPEALA